MRKVMIFALLGLLATTAAFAGVPSCANSTFPTFIDLVACNPAAGTVDPLGQFTVTVRDIGNFPVVNQLVSIQLKSDVATYDSDYCVEATTDASGVATFRIPGAGRNSTGQATYTGAAAARIFMGSCATSGWCATANVATYDENGYIVAKGVEMSDLSAWVSDFLAGSYRARSDFDHGNTVTPLDLSYWVKVFLANGSKYNCGATLYINGTW